MKLNTKTVIQSLPLNEDLKKNILSKWDDMDQDLRYEIENLVWEAYFELENVKVDERLQENFQKAKKGEIPLNEDFYKNAFQEVVLVQDQKIHEQVDSAELAAVRQKLELLMKDHI